MTSFSLIPEREASRALGLSVRTLQGWRLRGRGPAFVKLGTRVLYRESDIKSWVEASIKTSTSDTGKAA